MKHFFRITFCLLSTSFIINSCRTTTEPTVAPGMSAYINGTYWIADSTWAVHIVNGSCNFTAVYGWTGGTGGDSSKMIMIEIPDTLNASHSCASGGNYIVNSNQMPTSVGSLSLVGKSSSTIQGTFGFQGVVSRSSDTTHISNGKFNVNLAN